MPIHVVQQGECLSSIAHRYGFADPAVIYGHADNAELRRRRPDPHTLFPGDHVFVPERAEKEVDCSTGKVSSFKVKLPTVKLHVVLVGADGQPMKGLAYKLIVGDRTIEGTTTDEGAVEQDVPADATVGQLFLKMREDDEEGFPLTLDIGHLDPIEELSGVQARLENLGFHCGGETTLGARTRAAIAGFQKKAGLEPTGELTDETRQKLAEQHDG